MRMIKIIRIMRKISIGMEMTVKSLGEAVKVIILIITLLLSPYPTTLPLSLVVLNI